MIDTHTFESGLQVYVDHMPNTHSTAVNVIVGVGALDETETEAGISHLLEHCVHQETGLFKDEEARLEYEARNQYSSNANTSANRTLYFSRGPQFEPLMRGLAAFVSTPTLKDEHVAKEVAVVTREARMQLDNIGALGYFATRQHMFNSPYSRPVIGYWEDLEFSGEAVRDYYSRHYTLGTVAIIASGQATTEQVVAAADRYLVQSPLPPSETRPRGFSARELSPAVYGVPGTYGILGNQHNNVRLESYFLLNDHIKANLAAVDRSAHWLASAIIGASVAKSLRTDRQLSYDGGFGFSASEHPATWAGHASVTCEADKVAVAQEAIVEGIHNALQTPERKIMAEILSWEGSILMGVDDISSRTGRMSGYVEAGHTPPSVQEVLKECKELTPQDIRIAIADIIDNHASAESYVFIQGDEKAVEGLPIVAAEL